MSMYFIQISGQMFISFFLEESFINVVYNRTNLLKDVILTNIHIVKKRSLDHEHRDSYYPLDYMSFYLYGTLEQMHIEHMLLLAPNIQLSADRVFLDLDKPLCNDDIKRGVIVYAKGVHEGAMQPFPLTDGPQAHDFFFHPGQEFDVSIYKDHNDAVARGLGLANVDKGGLLATGSITLTANISVDSKRLNMDSSVGVTVEERALALAS